MPQLWFDNQNRWFRFWITLRRKEYVLNPSRYKTWTFNGRMPCKTSWVVGRPSGYTCFFAFWALLSLSTPVISKRVAFEKATQSWPWLKQSSRKSIPSISPKDCTWALFVVIAEPGESETADNLNAMQEGSLELVYSWIVIESVWRFCAFQSRLAEPERISSPIPQRILFLSHALFIVYIVRKNLNESS